MTGAPEASPKVVLWKTDHGEESHPTVVCGRVPWLYQYWPGGFMVLWFYVQELPKAQPAVVLVLKRLRRRGNSLKSHPTDWEKPGIHPTVVCGRVPWLYQYWPDGFMLFVVLCPGTP